MERILYLFMMFSIVGWLWETPWVSIRTKKFVNRGFLNGPYIPIYGFAVVTIILSMGIFDGVDSSKWYIVLVQLVYMGLVTAIWEFVTSYLLERLFHTRWWDYSSHKYNIQGRVSLYVTTFFAFGGYILWRFVLPLFDSIYISTSSSVVLVILLVFYAIFTIDSAFTLRDLFKVRNMMVTLEKLSEQLKGKVEGSMNEIKANLNTKKDNLLKQIEETKNELESRYKETQETLPPAIKKQFEKLTNTIKNNKFVARFYRRFPNSRSKNLQKIKLSLQSFVQRKGAKK